MQHYIYRALEHNEDEVAKKNLKNLTSEDLLDFITDFINDPGHEKYISRFNKQKHRQSNKNDFLICFDNADELIGGER